MTNVTNYFRHSPDPGGTSGTGNESSTDNNNDATAPVEKSEEQHEHKPLLEKIKEALQDWSNKDQADQDFDDTRV